MGSWLFTINDFFYLMKMSFIKEAILSQMDLTDLSQMENICNKNTPGDMHLRESTLHK